MKKLVVTLFLFLLVILSASFYPVLARSEVGATVGQSPIDPTTRRKIIEATIHIILYPKAKHEPVGAFTDRQQNGAVHEIIIQRARGIGSVVTYMGRVLIVTHDHWDWLSNELDRVELRDAQNELLLEMSGDAFRNIIRFRDGGTMILEAPGILLSAGVVPANISNREVVAPGSVVHLARRPEENRDQVDLLAAVVESTDTKAGRPILTLRSLEGESVIRGDSGGGVWLNGKLTGNLWTAITVETTVRQSSFWGSGEITEITADTSIAARFPLDDHTLETILATNMPSESVSEY
jgi:hypothetical protein